MRTIKCWIEMELVEGEHFNPDNADWSDERARTEAESSFVTTLLMLENELYEDWVQSKIVESPT